MLSGCEALSVNLTQHADRGVTVLVADFAIVVAVAIVQTCLAQLLSTVAARDTSSRRAEMATKLSAVWSIAISAFGTKPTCRCSRRMSAIRG
jgi:hypothetical protein